jgi:hypothetical protein
MIIVCFNYLLRIIYIKEYILHKVNLHSKKSYETFFVWRTTAAWHGLKRTSPEQEMVVCSYHHATP